MTSQLLLLALAIPCFQDSAVSPPPAGKTLVTVQAADPGKPISPDLMGIFFEDINFAADGGLYAELVQNRSFEYGPESRRGWTPLTAWDLVERGGGQGSVSTASQRPLHPSNPHHAVLSITAPGQGVGLRNTGYGGIAVKAGEPCDVSLFARQVEGAPGPLQIRLETAQGAPLAQAALDPPSPDWQRSSATLTPSATDADARLVVLATTPGVLALDMISLFPRATFHNRPNGLRADLAQTIADLKPRFVRFPGGCLVHGEGLENTYRWKDSIGPIEQRRAQRNLWGYHQSLGLGYFEYFQFCEDIGAQPLPVVSAGVCCQFRRKGPDGPRREGFTPEEMTAYIQDVLDLIEYANGPASSPWGARRAEAGHPEPFGLKLLAVGNEEEISPVFVERFRMILDAIRARHPEITVIGTAGPGHGGRDWEAGWKLADAIKLPLIDEHYYEKPEWFLDNLDRYDHFDRARSLVYVGEYAAHERDRKSTLRSALVEAAYLTGLERNADIVRMASYAPLLGKLGDTQWDPNLIYFTSTAVSPTINYYVQQLFGQNGGDRYLPSAVGPELPARELAVSAVRDSSTGDLILKLVHLGDAPRALTIRLEGASAIAPQATATVLAGPLQAVNRLDAPDNLVPVSRALAVSPTFDHELPAHSLTVLRFQTR